MIISASRRTDIPRYYGEWFLERLRQGFLYVRSPVNPRRVSRIELSPETVDCIVLWTKDPGPLMAVLNPGAESGTVGTGRRGGGTLCGYPCCVQFTLTGYGRDIEPGLPDKGTVLLETFRELSRRIGADGVIWRYDPIFINERYTTSYHIRAFGAIAEALRGFTDQVTISFLDLYAKTKRNMRGLAAAPPDGEQTALLARAFSQIAGENGMSVVTCAEEADLMEYGIGHGSCVDLMRIGRILGCGIGGGKDSGQRRGCGCAESVEIGSYDTCPGGCRYCYASEGKEAAERRSRQYDVHSPMLCDSLKPEDQVTVRKMRSIKTGEQLELSLRLPAAEQSGEEKQWLLK